MDGSSMHVLDTFLPHSLLMIAVIEMNRLLAGMIQVIQEVDTNTGMALCNEVTCSTMSAGRYVHLNCPCQAIL
jgi:hypothetical protein